ncbi:Beta-phosphoglucomutase [Alkalibacterium sp. AK22]|uniref:HAD family hydrolase n=1 Tax=Alkalibacterium sp. AK22 TaxID=1229520 RepID=UPI000452863A|nr:HAD family phosphatase [Alkalibacterium sp. AK22]EXJ22829.1 Beta-phosphoglucomutase [Alkalibacterium sp. AK22]
MHKLVIFDMDGLMFDTERLYYEANQKTADRIGIPFDYAFYRQFIGVSDKDFFKAMEERFETNQVDQFKQESVKDLRVLLETTVPDQKKGLKELLTYLKDNGYKMVVASSSERRLVLKLLENAGLYAWFDGIVGGDEVQDSKPQPDIFLKACDLIEGDVSKVLVLEDSLNGIKAAHQAGFPVVMVPDLIEPNAYARTLAQAICEDLHEVLIKIKSENLI